MMKKQALVWLCIALLMAGVGCQKSKYSNLQIGKIKLLGENRPVEAIEYLQKSIDKEPTTRAEAKAHLLIAYRRTMSESIAGVTNAKGKYAGPEAALLSELKQDVPGTAEQLIRILNEQNRIQQDAAQLLIELGPEAVPKLVEAFQRFARIQDVCLDILERMGSQAVDGLVDAAANPALKAYVRAQVIQALGRIGDAKVMPALRQIKLSDQDPAIQVEAAAALYKLGDRGVEQELIEGLDSENILVRRVAARIAGDFNPFPVQRVLKALEDPDAEVRLTLTQALQIHPEPEALEPLFALLLTDPDERVKNEAKTALANYGESIVPRLVEELPKQEDWQVRLRIVTLLGQPGVIGGIDRDLAYKLDQYYRKQETHQTVQDELMKLLKNPALPQ